MAEILTTRGMMDEALLDKAPFETRTQTGVASGTEWRFQGEVVKRNVTFTPTGGAPPPKGSE